jgi:hypothetical protein
MAVHRRASLVSTEAPSEITLCPRRKKWLPVLLGSVVFTTIGVWMASNNDWRGWLGLIGFGPCAIVSALMVSFPQVTSLRLTDEGFYMRSLFRTHFLRWCDVTGFGLFSVSLNLMVGFNYSAAYPKQKLGRRMAADLAGWEGALSDTYGMSAQELADLMNAWKRKSDEKPAE